MTADAELPQPTAAELAILKALWRRGSGTVREVWEDLTGDRAAGYTAGYTTVLKLLQIMTDKGLVRRDEARRSHVYRPARSEEQTQQRLVSDLLDRAFNGSAAKLVMQALATKRASAAELAQVRSLIEKMK